LFGLLEKLAQWTHKWFAGIAVLLFLAVAFLIVSDVLNLWIVSSSSPKAVKKVGEAFGEIAAFLAFLAMIYYVFRESYVITRRLSFKLPVWLDSFLKYWMSVLRLTHSVVGILVFVAVLVHGYVLWMVWGGGKMNLAVWTGLGAAVVLLLAQISGIFIRQMPKLLAWRYLHRLAGISFLVAYAIHKAVE